MKAIKLILATALFTGFAAFSFAGIGAQYWAQQGKNTDAQKTKVVISAESTEDAMNCRTCACCSGTK